MPEAITPEELEGLASEAELGQSCLMCVAALRKAASTIRALEKRAVPEGLEVMECFPCSGTGAMMASEITRAQGGIRWLQGSMDSKCDCPDCVGTGKRLRKSEAAKEADYADAE